ncbi:MAG: leucine-rich repeat domain-containing protein [Dysgonamonadaceae bacterium]|nr:leucine-rich repeat domain-containing protein [Dysgonamonadaceae bacterium]
MRKSLFFLVMLLFSAANLFADSGTIGTLTWNLEDGTLTISGTGVIPDYSGARQSPWTMSGRRNSNINVILEEGVTGIGTWAISDCWELISVSLPSSLEFIGDNAFNADGKLSSINIPENVTTIGSKAFFGCSALPSVDIPAGVTSIGEQAFSGCGNVTDVTVHWTTPLVISSDVFSSNAIANAVLHVPNGTKALYEAADVWKDFGTIEETDPCATPLGSGTTGSLTWKLCPDGTLTISGTGAMQDYSMTNYSPWCSSNASAVTSAIVEEGVTVAGDMAFAYLTNLASVSLPASLTKIGYMCFGMNGNLTSIVIPSNVTTIGNNAFAGCLAIADIDIPVNVTSIGNNAFYSCTSLNSVTVHWDTPLNVPDGVFTSVTVANVRLIVPAGTKALYEAANVWKDFGTIEEIDPCATPLGSGTTGDLTWKVCPNGTLTISGNGAMPDCESMGGEPWASYKSNIKNVVVEDGVTTIGALVFFMYSNLVSVSLPNSIDSIGGGAFSMCSKLESVNMPVNLKKIDGLAFFQCSKLKSLDIPESVTEIGTQAFVSCGFTEVTVHWNTPLSFAADVIAAGVFSNQANTHLLVPAGTKALYEVADVWKDFGTIEEADPCATPLGSGTTGDLTWKLCPDGTLTISGTGEMQAYSMTNYSPWYNIDNGTAVTTAIVEEGVTVANDMAFAYLSNLASVSLPSSLTSIGYMCFGMNGKLTSIDIPDNLIYIRDNAFAGCNAITYIDIPGSVADIGNNAFYSCAGLDSVTVHWDTPLDVPDGVFTNVNVANVRLIVPNGTKALYEAANVWKDFIVVDHSVGIAATPAVDDIRLEQVGDKLLIIRSWATIDRVEILDLNGRTVSLNTGFSAQSIFVASLVNGAYVLKLSKDGRSYVKKFIKQ